MTFWPGCYKDWIVLSNGFTIQWISIRETQLRYKLHKNLSIGWCYPPFEQLGPGYWLLTC